MKIITNLNSNEIFVFGSNLSGIHAAGAARTAMKWGAQYGNPIGIQGSTYAIPTKDRTIQYTLPLNVIQSYVDDFIYFASVHSELIFLVTDIGCGLAGLKHSEVAPMFINSIGLDNVILPQEFTQHLD